MIKNRLQQYFPLIRTRNEVKNIIRSNSSLQSTFSQWKKEQQKEFLDFCSGARGVKVLYDTFFKEIFDPESAPERLEGLLSALLEQKVRIVRILASDSARIAAEDSLLTMDILVELSDGSLADIEVQKVGYMFPGQRAACYSSDLLLHQYRRVRSTRRKKFCYKDIQNIYVIVLYEKSPRVFHGFPDIYKHSFSQKSDSGLELDLLQKYIFVPLDIFKKNLYNKGIQSELDAWLAFLGSDDPEIIVSLAEDYPEFRSMYRHIYDICRDVERMVGMYSEELRILDSNTVELMVDMMQEELEAQNARLEEQNAEIEAKNVQLEAQNAQLEEQNAELEAKDVQLEEKDVQLKEKNAELEVKNAQLEAKDGQLEEKNTQLKEQNAQLEAQNARLLELQEENERLRARLADPAV